MSCAPRIIGGLPGGALLRLTLIPDPDDTTQFRAHADFQQRRVDNGHEEPMVRWSHDEIVAPAAKTQELRGGFDHALEPISIAFLSATEVRVKVHIRITHRASAADNERVVFDDVICECRGTNGTVCTSGAILIVGS